MDGGAPSNLWRSEEEQGKLERILLLDSQILTGND